MLAVKNIERYESLGHLSAVQQILAASRAKTYSAAQGELIIALGDSSDAELFLLDGRLKLVAQDGKESFIDTASKNARKAIAQLKPRRYAIYADSECRYFILNSQFVVGQEHDVDQVAGYYHAEVDISKEINWAQNKFIEEFASELWGKNFYLPCLTNIKRVIREYDRHGSDSSQWLINIINDDPGLALNLIAVANDPVIASEDRIQSIQQAVDTLDVKTTIELIQHFVRSNPITQAQEFFWRRLQQVVIHSREVAYMAKGFAELFEHLGPRTAYLAGLLHNIGEIALLTYIAKTQRFDDPLVIRNTLIEYRQLAGQRLLQEIGMPAKICDCARTSGEWMRGAEQLDYVDLVNVALIHCTMGRRSAGVMPKLKDVPAFQRMMDKGLAPDTSMALLKAARNRTLTMAGLQPEAV